MTARRKTSLRAAAERSEASTPAPGVTAISSKPIRTTLDLDPALFGDLQQWMSAEEVRTRRPVTKAAVLRALLFLLVNEPAIADLVRRHIAVQQ